jgi:hypothetical protein
MLILLLITVKHWLMSKFICSPRDKINKKDSVTDARPLDSEVRTLGWTLYTVCSNEIKKVLRRF